MNKVELADRLRTAGIIPIVTVASVEADLPLVDALVEGGATVVEIVLRTSSALEMIAACRQRHPQLLVAAGTVLDARRYDQAAAAGAQFTVSPGLTPALAAHAKVGTIPLVPGALTASEVMAATEEGFTILKYYPSEPSNGLAVLPDYAKVFPEAFFMPTGKIGPNVLASYAGLTNVLCVGGSWMFASGATRLAKPEIATLMKEGRSVFAARAH